MIGEGLIEALISGGRFTTASGYDFKFINFIHRQVTTDILTSTFLNFRAKLRSVAAGIAGTDEADDVIHDAFCRLWSRRQIVEDETQAIKLTYTAVRNSAIDSLRRSQARPTVSIDESQQLPETDDGESDRIREQEQTYEAVIRLSRRALNPRQFEVFELHDIRGLDYDEIAESLGMTPEYVRVTLSRARKTIRELYRKNNEA